eukprot:augustus_masked-scaffold_24-processed-gene-0.7-mRNA-1 protein AED:0.32 eAED:0.32 QI:0/-1/0/1/-1/1/1/0/915
MFILLYTVLLLQLPLLLNAQEIQKEEHILRSATIETLQENETAHFFLETDTSKFSCRNLLTVSYSLGDFCSFDENLRVEVHENGDFTVLDVGDSLCGGFGGTGRQLRTSRQYVSEDKSCFVTYNEGGFHGAMTLRSKQTQKVSLVSFEQVACSFDNELDCVELVTTGGEEFISRNLQGVVEDDLSPFYLERADDSCYNGITSSLPNKMFFGITTTTGFSTVFSDDTKLILQHIERLVATANLVYIQQINFRLVVSHITILMQNPDLVQAAKPMALSQKLYPNSIVRNLQEESIWTNRDFSSFNSDSQFTCNVNSLRLDAFNNQAPQKLVSSWILLAGFCQGFAGISSRPGICLTSGTVGSSYVPMFSSFYAYNFIHEVAHLFGASHYLGSGVMKASGVSLREGEIQLQPNALRDMCSTLRNKIPFCERTDIKGLRAVEMFPESKENSFMDGKLDAGCECDPRNECCNADCTLADSSVTCSTESGTGYCRNGGCEGVNELCKRSIPGVVDYCGVEDDNPCQGKCSQTSDGITTCSAHPSAQIKDGTKCSVKGTEGLCSAGTCLLFDTASPSNGPTAVVTPSPTLLTTGSPTQRPTDFPSSSPTISPSLSPSTRPTVSPSLTPTFHPTDPPTQSPSHAPTVEPSISPTTTPTDLPTSKPSFAPTLSPTLTPSFTPTISPSRKPSTSPSSSPTTTPSASPSITPSWNPSFSPTLTPTLEPSVSPSEGVTNAPTQNPVPESTSKPSSSPSSLPTLFGGEMPGDITLTPSSAPTGSYLSPITSTPTSSPNEGNGTLEDTASNEAPGNPGAAGLNLLLMGIVAAITFLGLIGAHHYTKKRNEKARTFVSGLTPNPLPFNETHMKKAYNGQLPKKAPLLSQYSSSMLTSIMGGKSDPFNLPDARINLNAEKNGEGNGLDYLL